MGPCGDQYLAFSRTCVKRPRDEPMPEECFEIFRVMRDCYEENPDYYGTALEYLNKSGAGSSDEAADGDAAADAGGAEGEESGDDAAAASTDAAAATAATVETGSAAGEEESQAPLRIHRVIGASEVVQSITVPILADSKVIGNIVINVATSGTDISVESSVESTE